MNDEGARFAAELDVFRKATDEASQYLYAYLTIHRMARRRRRVEVQFRRNSLFWLTLASSLQISLLITLGRVFDQKSKHNLDRPNSFGAAKSAAVLPGRHCRSEAGGRSRATMAG